MVDAERERERERYACFDSGAAESETTQHNVAIQILHGRCQIERQREDGQTTKSRD